MKKLINDNIKLFIGIIIGGVVFGGGVYALTLFSSNQILYANDKTVEEALNDLYVKSNVGNATAADIKSGKTALVGGKEVTGSLTCPTCPSYTTLSGTTNVGAGSYSTLLNGYYNLSNYRIKCGSNSCAACNSCCSCSYPSSTRLWTNSSPSGKFGTAPTISLSQSVLNFDYIRIVWRNEYATTSADPTMIDNEMLVKINKSYQSYFINSSTKNAIGFTLGPYWFNSGNGYHRRAHFIDAYTIKFTDASWDSQTNSFPLYIDGIRGLGI